MKRLITSLAALALIPVAGATEFSVSYSDDFAEALTEEYGEREGTMLSEELTEDLQREFEKRDVNPAKVDVTIIDAKPNRPTFKQLGDTPGLSLRSISVGGMKVLVSAYDDAGELIAEKQYDYYDNDIRDAIGSSVWTEAMHASNRIARNFAKELAS